MKSHAALMVATGVIAVGAAVVLLARFPGLPWWAMASGIVLIMIGTLISLAHDIGEDR